MAHADRDLQGLVFTSLTESVVSVLCIELSSSSMQSLLAVIISV